MSGNWTTFSVPDTSTGTFFADVMILLTDGSLLVHNGYAAGGLGVANQWLRLTPDTAGRYENGTWSQASTMQWARQWFASGVLPDGRVFVIGGEYCNDPSNPGDTPTGEIFDPQNAASPWSPINKPASMDFAAGDCNGTVLADGRVMIGGANSTAFPETKRTAIWDPVDNTWVEAGLEFGALSGTTKTDPFSEESWTLLPDGSVLAPAVNNSPQAQRYVPSLDSWVHSADVPTALALTTLNGVTVNEIGPALGLPDGSAFVVGGTGNTAVFTPGGSATAPGTWTAGPTLPQDTSTGASWPTLTALDSPGAVLPSGKVVFLGGNAEPTDGDYFSSNPVFFEYTPGSAVATVPELDVQPSLPSGNQTWQSFFMILPTGQLLCSAQTNTLFLYTPDASQTPDPAWKPANLGVPGTMATGHSYQLTGTQLNGLTQAVSYGDDAGMATNFPIVRLTSQATGTIQYVRSHTFSTMGIATGTNVPGDLQSCTIDIPATLPPGAWSLQVIANGIASDPVTVQIVTRDCYFILDNSTFGIGEVDTYLHATPPVPAVFDPAFYVVVEGYTPQEAGLSGGSTPVLPNIPSPFPGHATVTVGPAIPQDPTLPPAPQAFTFPCTLTFLDDSMFGATGSTAVLTATFTAAGETIHSSAEITLTANPNPYILHGDPTLTPPGPWYLSRDLKVFQLAQNTSHNAAMFGASLGSTGSAEQIATAFIQAAVTNLREDAPGARAAFDALPPDEDTAALQLQPTVNNQPVYNFAIARVRFRDTATASNVRVFFRIWQAQQTNASYNATTYARAVNGEGQPIPVLGMQGDEIVTIPFFAQARQTTAEQLHLQQDDFNRHDIVPGSGETDYFFGCWLDVNQPNDPRYPARILGVGPDGPFDTVGPLFPIQQFMVAAHQCLIAEIAYDPDPIAPGADPSTSDKLAQRNLAFVGAPNPGLPGSRQVPQTFEVRPTSPKLPAGFMPDELMIEWDKVPPDSFAQVYLPAVNAADVVSTAAALHHTQPLTAVDAHTVRFPAAGITYLPIPRGAGITFAGLLTVELPIGIRAGEKFTAVVRQITTVAADRDQGTTTKLWTPTAASTRIRSWRRTTGVFKLTIPVSTKAALLRPEEEYFAVIEATARTIPPTSRWYPVMQRYLEQIAERITDMGGDPAQIPPSPLGTVPSADGPHWVGKAVNLAFDRFGDFEGFTLETEAGVLRRFDSREPGIAQLITEAWKHRYLIRVLVRPGHPHRPAGVEFLV